MCSLDGRFSALNLRCQPSALDWRLPVKLPIESLERGRLLRVVGGRDCAASGHKTRCFPVAIEYLQSICTSRADGGSYPQAAANRCNRNY